MIVVVYSRQIPAKAVILRDVEQVTYSTAAMGGFIDAEIVLQRSNQAVMSYIQINLFVQIHNENFDLVWEGTISDIEYQSSLGVNDTLNIKCLGGIRFLSNTRPYQYSNTAGSASFVGQVYYSTYWAGTTWLGTEPLPSTFSNFLNSPFYNISDSGSYYYNNGSVMSYTSTQPLTAKQHLDTLMALGGGSNSNYDTQYYQIWEGMNLYLNRMGINTPPLYETNKFFIGNMSIGTNSSTFYTGVTTSTSNATQFSSSDVLNVSYDSNKDYQFNIISPSQSGGTRIGYRNIGLINISQNSASGVYNPMTNVWPQWVANKYTNTGFAMTTASFTINKVESIRLKTGQRIHPSQIKACNYIRINDYISGIQDGNNYFDLWIDSTKVTYKNNSFESLEISTSSGLGINDILARIIANSSSTVGTPQ